MKMGRGMFGVPWGGPTARQPLRYQRMPGAPVQNPGIVIARPGPAPWFGGPGGCNFPLSALSEAYEFLVIGLANPFALRWVPVSTIFNGESAGEIFALGLLNPLLNNADTIHPGDGGVRTDNVGQWHHISIGVTGESIYLADEVPANPERFASSNGNMATILKARITVSLGASKTRTFDIDIGAGVEIDIKCRAVMSIVALVPDPTSVPDAIPEEFATGERTFAVVVTTCVSCASVPQGYSMPATYSQLFFANEEGFAATMPIVSAARHIELFASSIVDVAGSVRGDFVYVLDSPVVPSITPTAFAAAGGSMSSAPGQGQTRKSIIPGNVNAIIVSASATQSVINVVQMLNV